MPGLLQTPSAVKRKSAKFPNSLTRDFRRIYLPLGRKICSLFVTQRFDGIQLGSLIGRVDSEEKPGNEREPHRQKDGLEGHDRLKQTGQVH